MSALALLTAVALAAPPTVTAEGSSPAPLSWALPMGATGRFEVQLEKRVTQRTHPPPGPDGAKSPVSEETVVLPQMVFEVAATVVVRDAQRTEVRFVATKPRFAAREGTEPGAGSALTVAFGGIAEIAWTVTLDAEGRVTGTALRKEPYPDSTLEVLQCLVESVSWAWVALPTQPVGVGGRFTSTVAVRDGAFPMDVTTEGERLVEGLRVSVVRKATAAVDVPATPEGITARYEDAKTTITGTLVHDAAGLPVRAQLEATASVVTRGTAGGQPFSIESTEHRTVTLKR